MQETLWVDKSADEESARRCGKQTCSFDFFSPRTINIHGGRRAHGIVSDKCPNAREDTSVGVTRKTHAFTWRPFSMCVRGSVCGSVCERSAVPL